MCSLQVEARTVFCDDIRRESNGKAILIGVYTDDLVPSAMPAKFPLSVWIKAKGIDHGRHPFVVEIAFPGVEEALDVRGEIEVDDSSAYVSLVLIGFAAEVRQPGVIGVKLDIHDKVVDAGELVVKKPRDSQP